jgi:hypothetical protein
MFPFTQEEQKEYIFNLFNPHTTPSFSYDLINIREITVHNEIKHVNIDIDFICFLK